MDSDAENIEKHLEWHKLCYDVGIEPSHRAFNRHLERVIEEPNNRRSVRIQPLRGEERVRQRGGIERGESDNGRDRYQRVTDIYVDRSAPTMG